MGDNKHTLLQILFVKLLILSVEIDNVAFIIVRYVYSDFVILPIRNYLLPRARQIPSVFGQKFCHFSRGSEFTVMTMPEPSQGQTDRRAVAHPRPGAQKKARKAVWSSRRRTLMNI